MSPVLLATLGAIALGLVACGGDSGPDVSGSAAASIEEDDSTEEIEQLTERFEAAVAARDAKALCRLLAPSDVLRLGGGETRGREECLEVWGPGRNPLFRAEDPDFSIEKVSFEGSFATAKLANGGELAFSHEGGRWYVHLAAGPGQGAKE